MTLYVRIRGHMEWARETNRYRTPENAKTGELHDATPFTVDWTDHPSDDNPEPPQRNPPPERSALQAHPAATMLGRV
ncbi:hypothetical protein [Streptomyces sp. NPDC058412]|uniref:hypothetical protein n=1 Tax=Streptomyces sp. NPDC058412 TaxID=3346486 RepID=UPI0036525C73